MLLLEWQVPDQEKTTAIKLQFCTSTGMRSSWTRKDNANQGAVCTATTRMRSSWSRKFTMQSSCSLHCYWNENFLIKKDLEFALLLEWDSVLDQEKFSSLHYYTGTRSSWSRKDYRNQVCGFKCYWNEKILMKKKNRNLVCSLQCCSWNEKFLIKKRLLTVDPFHWCFFYLNTRFMSKHHKERIT